MTKEWAYLLQILTSLLIVQSWPTSKAKIKDLPPRSGELVIYKTFPQCLCPPRHQCGDAKGPLTKGLRTAFVLWAVALPTPPLRKHIQAGGRGGEGRIAQLRGGPGLARFV